MKQFILLVSIFVCSLTGTIAQSIIATSTMIEFFSSTSVEDIKATNKACTALIVPAKGDILFKIPNRNFKFEKALMEEHFNENYMETEKFPNSDFRGKINEPVDYTKDGVTKVTVTGKMQIHGVTKDRTIPGTITISKGKIIAEAKFDVALKDHDIKIPSVVTKNLAENIAVTVKSEFPAPKN
jgi:hypothetical protein